ncbi:hypothetical protein FGE12_13425 [Aggregicoccus sp. 17bor-14]|uniref:CotH kinase family protein n=1 Tax=Myxococcaceae TaxID=31 RepID=UPI00129CB1C8|nr:MULTISPECIES: CotH kinase family protein [Myxococcaceae]MBF5043392.1 CotH kinase family protein [Simulacricoccus sp. 17bor-14]MRI89150.1 hypothetical protein [Aggregicoccus sp. 17bor-14]
MKRTSVLLFVVVSGVLLAACGAPAAPEGAPAVPPPAPLPTPSTSPGDGVPPEAQDLPPLPPGPPGAWLPERDAQGWPRLQAELAHYRLDLAPADLELLYTHLWDEDLQVPGRFTAYGRTWAVQVSLRGQSTRKAPKKSFQVRFDKDDRFMQRKRIELLAEYADAGALSEKLWYDTAGLLGLQAPLARFVTLEVNGEQLGVMTELEAVTKDFLVAHGLDADGDVYRCGMYNCDLTEQPPPYSYQEPWDKRTNEDAPWDGLNALLSQLNRTPPQDFAAWLTRRFDVEGFLTWMALDAFIANDYQTDARSFLVYEPRTGQWRYVPWDLNNAWSHLRRDQPADQRPWVGLPVPSFTAWDPTAYELAEFRQGLGATEMRPAWCTLRTRILMDPTLRARYAERLRTLLAGPLSEAQLGARIDATAALLAGPLAEDPFALPDYTAASAPFLRRFVRERRDFLQQQLSALEQIAQTGPLKLDRAGRDAQGRLFVQVLNTGAEPVSLGGLYLTGALRDVKQAPPLPALTLQPGTWATFWERPAEGELALGAQVDPQRPELGLYTADAHHPLDLLWLPPQAPGEALARSPRGAEHYVRLTDGAGTP